jgi:hypothetical protein
MTEAVFRRGRYMVSGTTVRARNRSLKIGTIEGVQLSRPFLGAALVVCLGLTGMTWAFSDLLYAQEIAAMLGIAFVFALVGWFVGSLTVFSKLTRERGFTSVGPTWQLMSVRDEIERVLAERNWQES